ncbi:hypothetical protein J6590_068757 [Homalodisca vitripennis]|nr:hypothetical protein J6590_068757 [Homalodisca vitripennis]
MLAYVKKKIDLLRGNFRREHKKVIESKRSGAGTDAVHVPKLWYYKLLLFLSDQEEVRLSITSLDSPTKDLQQTGAGHADEDVLRKCEEDEESLDCILIPFCRVSLC